MTRTKNWSILCSKDQNATSYHLRGNTSEPGFALGERENSPAVFSARYVGGTLEICTVNSQWFTADKEDIFVSLDGSAEETDGMNVLREFCWEFLGERAGIAFSELEQSFARRTEEVRSIADMLQQGTLYLEVSSECRGWFSRGFFRKKEGEFTEERYCPHSGMFQDSIILDLSGVRYFPKWMHTIEFYNSIHDLPGDRKILDGTVLGYIHNAGKEPFLVIFTWGAETYLHPGETVKVVQGMKYKIKLSPRKAI